MDGSVEGNGGTTEQPSPITDADKQEIVDIISKADALTLNPDQRAMRVWEVLKESPRFDELSTWDITCFAAAGVALFHQFHPWLEEAAKNLAQICHTVHYANYEVIVKQEQASNLNKKS